MPTLLNFENLQDLEFVTGQYASKGVLLDGDSAHTHPAAAHSGTKYLNPWRREFAETAYFNAAFQPVKQKRVALWAGTEGGVGSTVFGVFRAYAVNGTQIAMDGPRLLQVGVCGTRFEVNTPSNQIASVVLQMFGFDAGGLAFDPDQAIDDLEFEADPRPPSGVVRQIPIEPNIFNPWWWIETRWGLVAPGPPPPWETWLQPFAAALALAITTHQVARELRSSVIEIASKQASIASAAITAETKADRKG